MQLPKNQLVNVKVEDIRAFTRPVYPDSHSWDDTIACLLEDPVERALVEHLANELKTKGNFRNPVRIEPGEGYDFGDDYEGLVLANGTHRSVAAMISGHESILTVFAPEEHDDDRIVVLNLQIDLDDDNDDIWSVLRSFEVDEDHWIENDVASKIKDEYQFILIGANDIAQEKIEQAVEKQIKHWFTVPFSFTITKTTTEEHWRDLD